MVVLRSTKGLLSILLLSLSLTSALPQPRLALHGETHLASSPSHPRSNIPSFDSLPLTTRSSSQGEYVSLHRRSAPIPDAYLLQGLADESEEITMRIGLRGGDMNGLEKVFSERLGTGMHMTKEEVNAFAAPSQAQITSIHTWLTSHSISPSTHITSNDRITLTLPISLANQLFRTTFKSYLHIPSNTYLIRTEELFVPIEVAQMGGVEWVHPGVVFDGVHHPRRQPKVERRGLLEEVVEDVDELVGGLLSKFPIPVLSAPASSPPTTLPGSSSSQEDPTIANAASSPPSISASAIHENIANECKSTTTPACLEAMYGIPSIKYQEEKGMIEQNEKKKGNSGGMVVTGFIGQYANEKDFELFLEKFRPDIPKDKRSQIKFHTSLIDGGQNSQEASSAGIEANLDIQYSLGMTAPSVNTTFLSVGDKNKDGDLSGFLDVVEWINGMSDGDLPRVVTTSYGANEVDLPADMQRNLCNKFMQLTARGVSILFSSGDGGVAGTASGGTECSAKKFLPTFPSNCPYVTSVGSVGSFSPEVGSSFSSGGFSDIFSRPQWQDELVKSYLEKLDKGSEEGNGKEVKGWFNTTGRAFPDLSLRGEAYQIFVSGKDGSVDGTSASTPVFAAMIALLNAELSAAGKNSIGFLNPILYAANARGAFNDVKDGSNPGCGTKGFKAVEGWDAVTGLGTPKYEELRKLVGL